MKLLLDSRDVRFALYEQFKIGELCKNSLYAEFSTEIFEMVLLEAEKLSENEFYPTNAIGDREGCRFDRGLVKVPESFKKAYAAYRQGAWLSMSDPPHVGGQGLPFILANPCIEYFAAGNWALTMFPGLTHGSACLVDRYASEEMKNLYMEKLFSGEWCGTMCLTEPNAGTDVGNLRTKAVPRADGSYSISGQKIFISCGMHDLTDNIVHMVLARTPNSPAGVRGISIFLVPRLRYDADLALVPNDVECAGIERKLGIHGSPTCVLNFGEEGDCTGYLLGGENQGMRIMFEMMNEARLFVGVQGLGLASTAYLHALQYSKERIQGAPVEKAKDPFAEKVPIIQHPDVRRMLMFMKSSTEGMRALVYLAAYCIDLVRCSRDQGEAERFQGYVDILIPICKAVCSDLGFRVCETAIQVYGGYGYVSDYPVEQFLRDVKIASIYEGSNGIQAQDLVGRKLNTDRGKLFKSGLAAIEVILAGIRKDPELRDLVAIYEEAQEHVVQVTKFFALKGMTDELETPLLNAKPYLDLCGDVVVGFLLLWQAHIAGRKLREICKEHGVTEESSRLDLVRGGGEAAFYHGKISSARFYINSTLTLSSGKARAIMNNDRSPLEIVEEGFALG